MCLFYIFESNKTISHLLIETFPIILCHKTEQGEKGPAKSIKACVTMVRIFPGFQTYVSLRARAEKHERQYIECSIDGFNMEKLISKRTYWMVLVKTTDPQW